MIPDQTEMFLFSFFIFTLPRQALITVLINRPELEVYLIQHVNISVIFFGSGS